MEMKLHRDKLSIISSMGELFIDGSTERECFTLEDEDRKLEAGGVKVYGRTAIPRGRYKVELDWSPKYGRDMPHVLDVPGFTGIRIHSGNRAEDTEGCILVGRSRHENWLRDSKIAFEELLKKLNVAWAKGEEVWLTIT
jgi:hypothetical protein